MTDTTDVILGLETSTANASVALLRGDELLAEATFLARRTMAQRLAVVLDKLCAAVDVGPADIAAVGVGLGPGSFTSLRVGLALAKGLVLGSPRRPAVLGVLSLEALAAAAPLNARRPVCPVIAAPKRQLYAALYARRDVADFNCLLPPCLLPVETLAEQLAAAPHEIAVTGVLPPAEAELLRAAGAELLPPVHGVPRAALVAWLAAHRLRRGERHDLAALTPCYVAPSEAEIRFGQTFARWAAPESHA